MAKRKMTPNQLANLEKGNFANLSPSERKEIARRGAAKTNQIRAEKKTFAQLFEIYSKLPDEETGETNEIAVVNAMFKKAKNGDVSAFTAIRDTMGQKPTDKQEVTNIIPQIVVEDEKHKQMLEDL